MVRAGDLDVAAILGMGFPPFRGGIVHWADQVGATRIASRLREWNTRYGGIYQPCPYLEAGDRLFITHTHTRDTLSLNLRPVPRDIRAFHWL